MDVAIPFGDKTTATSLRLAHHVHTLKAGAFSAATREAALRCVLDLLCAAAAGFNDPGVRAGRQAALDLFGPGPADVWFSGTGANLCGSVMANSLAASALDLDDGYRAARGHPGAAAIPAAWAMLAGRPATPADADNFLEAIVAGYELGIRMAMGRLSYAPSGAWSAHAVIGAAGKLSGASPEVIAQALGIAAQTAPALPALAGLMGSDVKEGIGWGSVTGLAALQLAQTGFTGPSQILDEPSVFNTRHMLDGLGGPPLIEDTYFKPFACCRHIHGPLDAYLALAAQHRFAASDVVGMEVHTYRATFNLSNLPAPRTLVEAQYSAPYCMALCAVHGTDALLPMRQAHLRDAAVLDLAGRTTVHHDPLIEPLFPARSPARVNVILAGGRWFSSPLTDPRGDPANPLSWDQLRAKFLTATAQALSPGHQDRVLGAIDRLRDGDLAPLRAALRLPASGS